MTSPRVRFAPSPTGYLHIGGARTALFNWLWARKQGGTFILRIEDTDRERSTEESIRVILESMRWLGMDWDEGPEVGGPNGPYFQTQRLSLYRDHAERLIREGHAYRCYCTKEDMQRARDAWTAKGTKDQFRYPGTCRERADDPNRPHVVRFKSPETGVTSFDDMVRGKIEVPNSAQQDFVLLRTDGIPLYSFGAVVDDVTMQINLVARGDDHIVNTPPQLLLYDALGHPRPTFAHLPMILAPNGEKLSKRHAAVSVLDYREQGYLPDAVLNYLARLGWSHGDDEIFTRLALVGAFDWAAVGKTAGKYDAKKFLFVQAEHLRMLPDAQLAQTVVPFLARRGVDLQHDDPRLLRALPYTKPRASTLVELADAIDYFLRQPPRMEADAVAKHLTPAAGPMLRALAAEIRGVIPFDPPTLEAKAKAWLERANIPLKDMAQPARVALTGRTRSPGLFEVIFVLGEELALARLEQGAAIAENAAK